MFARIDKDESDGISKAELAQFMLKFINNRESFKVSNEYMVKMKELKSFIDQQMNLAVGQLKNFEEKGGQKIDPKLIYEKAIKDTVQFQMGKLSEKEKQYEII